MTSTTVPVPDFSALARWRQAQRQRVPGECAVCHKPFVGVKQRRYCGNTCASRANRALMKQERQSA